MSIHNHLLSTERIIDNAVMGNFTYQNSGTDAQAKFPSLPVEVFPNFKPESSGSDSI